MTGWPRETGAGAALHFFVYDLLKIVVLIAAISFGMKLIRQALPMETLRSWLAGGHGRVLGYPAAAIFGALTPFCSCSSVPIFLGFVQARFPIGVAFAFLITSPLVNEIAFVLMGVAFGAALHGYVPGGFFERLFAGTGAWTVPLASLIGLPLYVSANATVPLLEAFVAKGVPLGTALAFLLSAVGVSFPELVMLRSVMTTRLLVVFSSVVLGGTTLIGRLFNAMG